MTEKSKDAYVPLRGSLAHKVCMFFLREPDEELLSRQIVAKFGEATSSVANVTHQLARAKEAGYLIQDGSVYSPGKNLPKLKALLQQQETQAAEREATPPAVGRHQGKAFAMDLSTIKIEAGVPLTTARVTGLDWSALFGRMQPGDSFALPMQGKSSVQKAATVFKRETGAEMAVRKVAEGGLRVWRVK